MSLDAANLREILPEKRYTLIVALLNHMRVRTRDDLAEMFIRRTEEGLPSSAANKSFAPDMGSHLRRMLRSQIIGHAGNDDEENSPLRGNSLHRRVDAQNIDARH